MRAYVSQAFDGTGALDNHAVAGLDALWGLRFNMVPLSVTSGVALRLPHDADAGAREVQIYIRIGGEATQFIPGEAR